jgi:hypothetical protein
MWIINLKLSQICLFYLFESCVTNWEVSKEMHPYVTKLMYQCCTSVYLLTNQYTILCFMRWLLKNIEVANTIWRDSHMYINKRVHLEAALHFATCCVFSYGTFIPILGTKTHKEINLLSIEILFIDHIHDWNFGQDPKKKLHFIGGICALVFRGTGGTSEPSLLGQLEKANLTPRI